MQSIVVQHNAKQGLGRRAVHLKALCSHTNSNLRRAAKSSSLTAERTQTAVLDKALNSLEDSPVSRLALIRAVAREAAKRWNVSANSQHLLQITRADDTPVHLLSVFVYGTKPGSTSTIYVGLGDHVTQVYPLIFAELWTTPDCAELLELVQLYLHVLADILVPKF